MVFSERFIEIDGCRLKLRRGGSGEPLLYLHGASGAPAVLPFMEKLAQRFDVLVPEHPGYGLSDEPEWLENIHHAAYRSEERRVGEESRSRWSAYQLKKKKKQTGVGSGTRATAEGRGTTLCS